MKKNILSIFLLAFCQLAVAQVLNFTNKADMPTSRAAFSRAFFNGSEYIINGFSTTEAFTSQIEKYDFVNNSWTTFATSQPTIAKRYGNAVELAGKLYLYNGITATGKNADFEVVELSTGNVSVLAGVNPHPVNSAGSSLMGDYPLSFGGCINNWTGTYSNKLYKIAPWGEWIPLADMPEALETKGTVLYNNGNSKLYVFGGYNQTVSLAENFEDIATTGSLSMPNWINVAEVGSKLFEGKTFASNKYAQITAFSGAIEDDSSISWLISPEIPSLATGNAFLTFDTKDGYDNGAILEAYVITDWTGNITTSSKTVLNAVISGGHTTGYAANFTNSGIIPLNGFSGNSRIAFKYVGGHVPLATTTFQIDNVKVYSEYKSRNVYVYDFQTNTWITQSDVLPQGLSAHDVAIEDPFSTSAKIYVTGDYNNQTFLGTYNTEDGHFTVIDQTNMIGRRHHGSEIFGGKLYLFGGNTTTQTSSALNSTQSADLATLGMVTINKDTEPRFYPNPATDKITFQSNIEEVLLFTFEGKKINVLITGNELDISDLNKGIYIIQGINKDGNRFSDKLIIK